ncbi:SDR family NAD(P)-dependent oxidoreductase, partial [Acinetobacter baumannii]|uniref:SDR family NAD(P)-dependent oxidoreductase n=1 Tax=Acinetobacter baumannii TaxID=470 RepID=UPI003AF832E3
RANTRAKEGTDVSMTGRPHDNLPAAVAEIAANAPLGKVCGFLADLSTSEGVETLISQHPYTDILVNNLGYYEDKQFTEITDEDW